MRSYPIFPSKKNVHHVRSYKDLIRSRKINIRKAMTHLLDKFLSDQILNVKDSLSMACSSN